MPYRPSIEPTRAARSSSSSSIHLSLCCFLLLARGEEGSGSWWLGSKLWASLLREWVGGRVGGWVGE